MKSKQKLKIGIIGLGVGEQHIGGYHKHPACEVVALCDFSEEKQTMAREKYPQMRVTAHADDLLSDPAINVISIASYDNYHYEQIVQAIDNDKHLFVEKPLCLHEKEAKHIHALLCQKPHLKLSSNLILRKSPRFIDLKQRIEARSMGKVFYVEGDYNYGRIHKILEGWRGQLDFYSIVYGGGIHMIDLLQWLTEDQITEVSAYGTNIATQETNFQYNDTVVSILQFKSGMIGKMTANFSCTYPHFHKLAIYGTNATFENGWPHANWYHSRDPNVPPLSIQTEYPGTHKGDLIYSFIQSILSGLPAEVTKEEIFTALAVCFAIEKATSQAGSVVVEYLN